MSAKKWTVYGVRARGIEWVVTTTVWTDRGPGETKADNRTLFRTKEDAEIEASYQQVGYDRIRNAMAPA